MQSNLDWQSSFIVQQEIMRPIKLFVFFRSNCKTLLCNGFSNTVQCTLYTDRKRVSNENMNRNRGHVSLFALFCIPFCGDSSQVVHSMHWDLEGTWTQRVREVFSPLPSQSQSQYMRSCELRTHNGRNLLRLKLHYIQRKQLQRGWNETLHAHFQSDADLQYLKSNENLGNAPQGWELRWKMHFQCRVE